MKHYTMMCTCIYMYTDCIRTHSSPPLFPLSLLLVISYHLWRSYALPSSFSVLYPKVQHDIQMQNPTYFTTTTIYMYCSRSKLTFPPICAFSFCCCNLFNFSWLIGILCLLKSEEHTHMYRRTGMYIRVLYIVSTRIATTLILTFTT